MRLFTGPLSMFGAKAQIAALEKGLDFELIMVPFDMRRLYEPKLSLRHQSMHSVGANPCRANIQPRYLASAQGRRVGCTRQRAFLRNRI
jgi:hypothetical protein